MSLKLNAKFTLEFPIHDIAWGGGGEALHVLNRRSSLATSVPTGFGGKVNFTPVITYVLRKLS